MLPGARGSSTPIPNPYDQAMDGAYYPSSDIVAVDPASDGMGGDEALHELLHATGHPTRLAWLTTGVYSPRGYAEEERHRAIRKAAPTAGGRTGDYSDGPVIRVDVRLADLSCRDTRFTRT